MIKSFRDEKAEALLHDRDVPALRALERTARRKLLLLHRARSLQDVTASPANQLETEHDGVGHYRLALTKRWRLCFRWRQGDAYEVEIMYQ